jgi:hypothetical protein
MEKGCQRSAISWQLRQKASYLIWAYSTGRGRGDRTDGTNVTIRGERQEARGDKDNFFCLGTSLIISVMESCLCQYGNQYGNNEVPFQYYDILDIC